MYVDLHIHTNASDGIWSVEQLLEKIIENKIELFSITDHDVLDNSVKMINYSKDNKNTKYIHGVEVTCDYNMHEYHLTVYGFDYNCDVLGELLEYNRNVRESFDEMLISIMNDPRLDVGEYIGYSYPKNTGGFKLVHYLMDKGFVNSVGEYFTWFNNMLDERRLEKKFKARKEVIQICKRALGKVFLAHPSYYYRDSHMSASELDDWKSFGIDGVECYSPYCKPEYYSYYVDYCKKNNLLISGGSDCHGDFTPERALAHPKVTRDMIRFI